MKGREFMHLSFNGDYEGFTDFANILEHILSYNSLHHFLSSYEVNVLRVAIITLNDARDSI